jgi:hypothetical protein
LNSSGQLFYSPSSPIIEEDNSKMALARHVDAEKLITQARDHPIHRHTGKRYVMLTPSLGSSGREEMLIRV